MKIISTCLLFFILGTVRAETIVDKQECPELALSPIYQNKTLVGLKCVVLNYTNDVFNVNIPSESDVGGVFVIKDKKGIEIGKKFTLPAASQPDVPNAGLLREALLFPRTSLTWVFPLPKRFFEGENPVDSTDVNIDLVYAVGYRIIKNNLIINDQPQQVVKAKMAIANVILGKTIEVNKLFNLAAK